MLGSSLAGLGGHSHVQQEKGVWGDTLRVREQVLLPWPLGVQSSQPSGQPKQPAPHGTMAELGRCRPDGKATASPLTCPL